MEYFAFLSWEFIIIMVISAGLKIATSTYEGAIKSILSAGVGVGAAIVFTPIAVSYTDFTLDDTNYVVAIGAFITIAGENLIKALNKMTSDRIIDVVLKRFKL